MPLDPQWRSFFTDGSTLDLVADVARMRATLDAYAPDSGAGDGYVRFMELSQRLHRLSNDFFFWRSVGGVKDMFDPRRGLTLSIVKDVMGMRLGRSVAGTVRSFVSDERAAQMLDHFTQYVGSAPDASPAVLCGIAHMQAREGVCVGHAVERASAGLVVPCVIEYPFWNERSPEVLVAFGEALRIADAPHRDAKEWNRVLADALEATQDRLAAAAKRRDPQAFTTVLSGRAGVGGVYDFIRRIGAWRRRSRLNH